MCATDPVMASDGHSYEHSDILTVLRKGNGLSPLTRKPLQPTFYPNLALKQRIQEYEEDMLREAAAAANASYRTRLAALSLAALSLAALASAASAGAALVLRLL